MLFFFLLLFGCPLLVFPFLVLQLFGPQFLAEFLTLGSGLFDLNFLA